MSEMMTKDQVDAEFGKVGLKFHSYFKYSFTFTGFADDGKTIEATYGRSNDDIYRYEVKARDEVPFVKCDDGWWLVRVFSGNTKVFEWMRPD
jgi:hypothetical protein